MDVPKNPLIFDFQV